MGGCRHGETCRGLRGLLRALFFCGFALAAGSINPAIAQDALPACSPEVGRIVSLQGTIEIQRPAAAWLPVRRLDTVLCAGDRLRADKLSRAMLFLQPETFLRVDQDTTISISVDGEEIEIEFFAAELAAELRSSESRGAGYFITRFPKKFKIKTPHMNAAVEGTEFLVELGADGSTLTVLEGAVSSESIATGEKRLVTSGQTIRNGVDGAGAIAAVVKPEDAVQWALRYPPIRDAGRELDVPDSGKCATATNDEMSGCWNRRAEALLTAGNADDALNAIDSALNVDPTSSDAHALRAVIQVAKNEKIGALESAQRAIAANAANHRAWLALSYAHQANFDLEAALYAARKAGSLQPNSSLAHARVSELLLSRGDSEGSEGAARAAILSNPAESHAYSMLGFVQLARSNIVGARESFLAAIERDSFSPLPRLGLGLAIIRDGNLVAGREQV
jgi:Tfp pilus assembly protein PilF